MKYGIALVHPDGTPQYVYSNDNVLLCYDVTEVATFVQLETAIDMVRKHRKYGFEPEGCEFKVIEVQFTVNKIIEVPRAKKKSGFVIKITQFPESAKLSSDALFYVGSKKPGVNEYQGINPIYFGNGERATTFDSVKAAEKRIAQLLKYAESELQIIKEAPDTHLYFQQFRESDCYNLPPEVRRRRREEHYKKERAEKILKREKSVEFVKSLSILEI